MAYQHRPVMLAEVMAALEPRPGRKFLDCTLGGAGYTLALAEAVGPAGKIISLDLDKLALDNAAVIIADRNLSNIVLRQDNFKNLGSVLEELEEGGLDGVVFDLGLSSAQLDDESRGFSFLGDRPLDMSFGDGNKTTADIVNGYPLPELTKVFREYGEEPRAYRAAKAIVEYRRQKRIRRTGELKEALAKALPSRPGSRLNPATKIFQALRMETNRELDSLALALPQAMAALKTDGRLVAVSFHSGEDRIVKRFFREAAKAGQVEILTKKPIVPGEAEIADNFRARSAKLRAAKKLDNF